jgi:hypothetical protein
MYRCSNPDINPELSGYENTKLLTGLFIDILKGDTDVLFKDGAELRDYVAWTVDIM